MRLSSLGSVAYFDVQDGDHSGHLRCSDASSAAAIVHTQMPGCSLELLTGLNKFILVFMYSTNIYSPCMYCMHVYVCVSV